MRVDVTEEGGIGRKREEQEEKEEHLSQLFRDQ